MGLPSNEPVARSADRASTPLDRGAAEALARTLRAVSHPTRLQILSLITSAPDKEATVGELATLLGLTQPTTTHHLQMMAEDGVLLRERRGRSVWFSVAPERAAAIADLLG